MLELRELRKTYGDVVAVDRVSLTIGQGEFFCLLGPSGCGKTTVLRLIAGFEKATSGGILLDGEEIGHLPPYKRNVNTVFQNYALFPNYNIFDNVGYGLKIKKTARKELIKRVDEALSMVGLQGFETRKPSQLSGGQQQRVALARALVNRPRILLLDEPLSALDKKISEQTRIELAGLQRKVGITFVYVTHNQVEAMTMGDRIAVMRGGLVEQCAAPSDLYQNPVTRFVADFIGSMNFFEGRVVESTSHGCSVEILGHTIVKRRGGCLFSAGDRVAFGLRPEQLKLSLLEPKDFENGIRGVIEKQIFMGDLTRFLIRVADGSLVDVSIANYLMFEGEVMPYELREEVFVVWSQGSGIILHA